MSTELRRVPKNWIHPSDHKTSNYESQLAFRPPQYHAWRPLYDEDWAHAARVWWGRRIGYALKRVFLYPLMLVGLFPATWEIADGWNTDDSPPKYWHYRPSWPTRARTHYQLYETVSEGTPISPVCATIGELVEWCATQTREVWVGTQGMTREEWARFFERGGYSMSGVYTPREGFIAGVKYMARKSSA